MRVKVGDITKIKTGKLDANAASEDGEYPFFTCSREPLRISSYSYDCECVLVAGNGDLNVKYYNGKFDVYQRTYIIEDDSDGKLYMPYLYLFMEGYVEVLRRQAIGGVIKYIKLGNLTDAMIELPSVEEQRNIVEILFKAKHILEQREMELDKLDELIKARFVELFGDDIVQANLSIGDIAEETTVGIANSATHAYAESGVVMLRNQNIRVNYLDDSDLIYINPEFASKYDNKKLRENDILVTRTGVNVGMACLVPEKYAGCQTFTTLILRLKKNIGVSPTFVCHYINSPLGKGFIDDKKVGGAQPNFGSKQLATMPIAIPSEDKQLLFESFVKQVDKSKFIAQKMLDEAQLLFDSLMQEYFG